MEEHQKVVQMRLLAVCREITDSRAKRRDELDALYRRMVTYVILRSGLGSASDLTNVQEATGEREDLRRMCQSPQSSNLLRSVTGTYSTRFQLQLGARVTLGTEVPEQECPTFTPLFEPNDRSSTVGVACQGGGRVSRE